MKENDGHNQGEKRTLLDELKDNPEVEKELHKLIDGIIDVITYFDVTPRYAAMAMITIIFSMINHNDEETKQNIKRDIAKILGIQ